MAVSAKRGAVESAELDKALTRAIDFAANIKKQGKFKKETRTEKEQREKLEAIENEIFKSKKRVIKDVIRVRKLEYALKQSAVTGNALKKHVQTLPTLSKKKRTFKVKTQWMNETDLHLLDIAGNLTAGTASVLQRSLNMYNDSYLTQELNAFPVSQLNSMNVVLFSKVGWISSGKRMSLTEGIHLFDDATAITSLLIKRRPNDPFDMVRWEVLKRMLRALLRLRQLANSYLAFEKELRLRSAAQSRRHRQPESASSPNRNFSKSQVLHSVPRGDSHDAPLARTLPHLNKQLLQSQKRQEELSRKIKTSLSTVSRSVPLGAMKSAHSYARNCGAAKMMGVFQIKILGYYRIVFDKFRNNVAIIRAEEKGAIFQRLFGTWRLCRIFDVALQEKIQRHFHDWVEKIENMKGNEEWAAAVEIQRVGRGCIGRFNVRNRYRIAAAKQIQKIVRGGLHRKLCRALAYQRKLKWAVGVVEIAWRSCKWLRTLKYLFVLRKQTKAVELIQRVYRGHIGRTEGRARRLIRDQYKGALKMQCLWRRYEAICLVDEYYSRWKQVEASIVIQALVRSRLGRQRAKRFKLWVSCSCTIQRATRCRIARDIVYNKRRHLASIKIQRRWRGYIARKKVCKLLHAKKKAREQANYALQNIIKIIRGYYIRRRWVPIIKDYTAKRAEAMQRIKTRYKAVKTGNETRRYLTHLGNAAAIITRTIRRFITLCSDRARHQRLLYDSATGIQAVWRGVLGRKAFAIYAEQRRRELDMTLPLYYRLQKMYLRDQNAFHAKQVTKIQCLVRRVIAKQIMQALRVERSVRLLQVVARKYIDRQRAKDIVKAKRNALFYKDRMATRIQKVHRGVLGRHQASKHKKADMLKWFLGECKQVGLLKRCCINFRVRKQHLERVARSAIKIQAFARGYICRVHIRKIYKRLVRARDKRIHERRVRAATKIQSIVRWRQSRKIVAEKRAQWAERERRRKQLEDLDNRIDDIHASHLNDLLAVRVQKGVRGKLGRNTGKKQAALSEEEAKIQARKLLHDAAATIQSMARGVAGRSKFKSIESELRRQLKARAFCVECEIAVAARRCVECRDSYCANCFDNLHRKGKRKDHGWVSVRKKENEVQDVGNLGASNPMLWEEYWDESAQAKYWYHSVTGEATWICPY